jgi:D-alanyl-D-alanine carboxypeptidase
VRQLLQHTSGLPEYTDGMDTFTSLPNFQKGRYDSWTDKELVALAMKFPPKFEPGAEWSYSNTNYAIVGLIVEQATGNTLGEEMQTRIFDEFGLDNTTFAVDTTVPPQMAHGYLLGESDPIDTTGVFPFAYGAGNIVSDAADTATFYGALFGGEVVEPELLDEMLPSMDDAVPYGLGVMAWSEPCGVSYGHDGGVAGYSTRSLVLDGGRQVVILTNSITLDDQLSTDPAAGPQYDAIIDAALCG